MQYFRDSRRRNIANRPVRRPIAGTAQLADYWFHETYTVLREASNAGFVLAEDLSVGPETILFFRVTKHHGRSREN